MIGCAFRGVLGKSARAENCQAEPNGHGGRRKAGPPAKAGLGVEQDFGKFVSSFSASERPHIPDALQYRQNELVLAARYPYHPDRTFDRGLWSIEVFGERISCVVA